MKKRYFVVLILTQIIFSQAPSLQWQKSFGGTGSEGLNRVLQTLDGGYIGVGSTNTHNDGDITGHHSNYDIWVVKISNVGALQWQKTLGGSLLDIAYSIQQTADGGYIIAGVTKSTDGDVTQNLGDADCWIVKLSDSGDLQWQKTFGGSLQDVASDIIHTSDGGYIVAGHTYSINGDITQNHGVNDMWVVKISDNGVLQWQKSFGGTGNDIAIKILQSSDGAFIIIGDTNSIDGDVTLAHGDYDYWVVKMSSTGALQWQKTYGGSGDDKPNDIQQTMDGGFVIVGSSSSHDGDITSYYASTDYWVVKISNTGILEWQKTLGGSDFDNCKSVKQTSDGGYILSGESWSVNGDVASNHGQYDNWILKLSNTGNVVWQKSIGGTGDDTNNDLQLTSDGGFILAGNSSSNDGDIDGNHGSYDVSIVKLGSENLEIQTLTYPILKLFPNPTTSILTIQYPEDFTFDSLSISDLTGKKVLQLSATTCQIDVSSLSGGIYMIEAISGRQKLISKFVKQ